MSQSQLEGRAAFRLRIVVGENQRHEHLPVYEWLARRALDREMAGATVYRADLGYGASSRENNTGLNSLSTDASMIVELVDAKEALLDFIVEIEEKHVLQKGLATIEPVDVVIYRSS